MCARADGSDQGRLIKLAEKLRLNAEFTGRVHNPAVFLRSLDVFILASTREGLSISLQEAMSCGAIPVAVNNLGSREIIEDRVNGYLYNSGSHNMLAEKILKAINNKHISQKARETIVKRFNNKTATRKYPELYEELGIFLKD
jgi:glycosyltransferase involved in cell wall biosynthesis